MHRVRRKIVVSESWLANLYRCQILADKLGDRLTQVDNNMHIAPSKLPFASPNIATAAKKLPSLLRFTRLIA